MPRRRESYRGRDLEEMDLDRLLKRRPQLALVDELAHENAPGSRHPKRWMDVQELLAAGIDVWTTMNVQHVESLNDVVAQITHVRVRETVPDSVLDQAEIELIDLTPDELRERLHEGKVYVPEAASRALDHYFSPGNLTALRELALRRTAERVDDQMVQYMRAHGLAGPWAARERLLACVHGGEGAAELVRYTKRLADRLRAPWTAIHVQTAGDRRAGEAVNDRVADTLRLAERLGGETLVLPGERIAEEILAWARANNITQIVIGSVRRSGWRDWFGGSLPRDLIRGADDIVVLVLPEGGETAPPKRVRTRAPATPRQAAAATSPPPRWSRWRPAAAGCSRICSTSPTWRLVFVLPVLAAALAWGLAPALRRPLAGGPRLQLLLSRPALHPADQRSRERGRSGAVLGRGGPGQRHRRAHPSPDAGRPAGGRARRGPLRLRQEADRRSPRSTTCSGPPPTRSRSCSRPRWCSCCPRTAASRCRRPTRPRTSSTPTTSPPPNGAGATTRPPAAARTICPARPACSSPCGRAAASSAWPASGRIWPGRC